MTILELEFLLHCYRHNDVFEQRNSLQIQEAVQWMLAEGIITGKSEAEVFAVTEKGKVWLTLIMDTPQPTQVWVDTAGVKVESNVKEK